MKELFENNGGQFLIPEQAFAMRLQTIKAFVFDWDGVFTDTYKDFEMQSRFSEADSMGCNLLRFAYYLRHGKLPYTSIISGENNKAAFAFVKRECFHSTYYKVPDKIVAGDHICEQQGLNYHEIAFVFDDILDLSIARKCGLRIFIPRKGNPLLNDYVIKNDLADYVTAATSGQCPVRESCELLTGMYNSYDDALRQRVEYSDHYRDYLELRKTIAPDFYTQKDGLVCKGEL